jgi:hypothetical protein
MMMYEASPIVTSAPDGDVLSASCLQLLYAWRNRSLTPVIYVAARVPILVKIKQRRKKILPVPGIKP